MQCPDCPNLIADNMPADWTPRAICCADTSRRRQATMDQRRAAQEVEVQSQPSRQARRAAAARLRKARAGGRA